MAFLDVYKNRRTTLNDTDLARTMHPDLARRKNESKKVMTYRGQTIIVDTAEVTDNSRALLQVLDQMPLAVFLAEPVALTIAYANRHAVEHALELSLLRPDSDEDGTGEGKAELVGQVITDLHPALAEIGDALRDPSGLPLVSHFQQGHRWFEQRVTAITGPNDAYIGPLVTWREVTARMLLTEHYETDIMGSVENVARGAHTVLENADGMLALVEKSSDRMALIGSAAEQARGGVAEVVQATESVATSMDGITAEIGESMQVIDKAVQEARASNELVDSLNEGAERIGVVVRLINDIAGQTNLLALNATIEAARAGDAGKGFAVVASEVKALAGQTGHATGEIERQISEIRQMTGEAAQAMRHVADIVADVNSKSSRITGAMDIQRDAVDAIRRAVSEMTRTNEAMLSELSALSAEAMQSAGQVSAMRGEMSSLSGDTDALRRKADEYLSEVRDL